MSDGAFVTYVLGGILAAMLFVWIGTELHHQYRALYDECIKEHPSEYCQTFASNLVWAGVR